MNTIIWVILGALILIVGATVMFYNRLVSLRARAREAWSDIEVQLKRRYDLIPNLVETVKGYATHESGLFQKVTEARTAAMGAQSMADHAKTENMLAGALKSLFAVAENYPQLRAAENFIQMQRDLTDTEDKIQAARRFYNGNVRDLNIAIETFPSSLIASMFHFAKQEFFDLDGTPEQREPVKVNF
ncbi:MAG: hypothetical protein A3A80_00215 [Candidatus Terrybacteria bacterium RIFCSPLOWO2_01_FULL_44_24]|uniref:LemA family protein n=1 Tax=Candidatus Terrybacteria bacterium RIFCSPHIGHO2_01_FULL_43_35 TaxID=1802361 RepID=A0A1G2PHG1_9BACT|nr:MAG: hypothetical protein A2828_04315 [Candidatus Terrybacteria bacterium RIFCSPHIGHO2_01_FULL_43_35]OHA50442.1 MAG: hypothetical protein A3B75_00780 [Candidatus Terrybacteria bacterium RIFCSPHIGHO2_02_FULL_43_14]OHA51101.1 MAG: hypothetical protein A3A80_00215 [Candidatus Terrybacteria bacterium RIFCSPLOWO2_01_FULL_44_24]